MSKGKKKGTICEVFFSHYFVMYFEKCDSIDWICILYLVYLQCHSINGLGAV